MRHHPPRKKVPQNEENSEPDTILLAQEVAPSAVKMREASIDKINKKGNKDK